MNIKPKIIPKLLHGSVMNWEDEIGINTDWTHQYSWLNPSSNYSIFDFSKVNKENEDFMEELPKNTPPSSLGTKLSGILKFNKNRNNIYFNLDWSKYHNWHSRQIVLPWLYKLSKEQLPKDWEETIKTTLDSWDNAGGFDWLNATSELRQHGMLSDPTFTHLELYYNNPLLRLEDNMIGVKNLAYSGPERATTADRFTNGTRTGLNNKVSDNDFGVLTGNRRPTIHINTNDIITRDWDEYYRKLGYTGKYVYKDHWVPTKDKKTALVLFNDLSVSEPSVKTQIEVQAQDPDNKFKGFDWSKIREVGKNIFNNPNLYALGRLAGNLINNERIYDELLKGINPVLRQTYYTHRQVVGDEATKLGYYRRAAQGQTKASRPFTADADKLVAYMNEAKRIGDELRAQGDLADNAEIRRTSDESNQHQWANVQRATEVANANLASMNQANAQRHNLLALKHAALWSSIDNYLLGIETRKRLQEAEAKTINKELFLLLRQQLIADDPTLNSLQAEYEKLKKDPNNYNIDEFGNKVLNRNSNAIRDIEKRIKQRNLLLLEETYRRWRDELISAKSGTKITYKKKDDLLYKTAKDVVDHFRKMSKISSDALNRKTPKIEKLTSHPKGKTRRYLSGGVAPFTVYRPATLGGSTEVSSQTSSSKSSKEDSGKNTLDFLKELFKSLQGEGLPIDVNAIYSNLNELFQDYKTFGKELDTTDLSLLYLQSMQQLNNVKHSKDIYDKAKTVATLNEALNEYAVTADGSYVVLNKDVNSQDYGKIDFIKLNFSDIDRNKYTLLTNQHLLYLREYSPLLLLRKGDFIIENVINNGMGINKIGALIKALAGNIGSTDSKIEGITKIESDKIKAGIKELLEAPEGYYKITLETKNPNSLINYALNYIAHMLSPSLRAILDANGGTKTLIGYFLSSQAKYENNFSIDPLSGKASKSNGESDGSEGKITPAVALSMGLGERTNFVISDKTSDGLKISAVSLPLLDASQHGIATGTLDLIGSGAYTGQLLLDHVTMGGAKVSQEGLNNILISGGRIYSAELPIDLVAFSKGLIKPNLDFLKNIEKADLEIRQAGITNRDKLTADLVKLINNIYTKNSLPLIYSMGDKGPVLTGSYRRFAMLNATATEDSFEDSDPHFNNGVTKIDDKNSRSRFESTMKQVTKNDKYLLKDSIFGGTDLFKGIIYIPMTESHISALAGTGYRAAPEVFNAIEELDQQAEFIRNKGLLIKGSYKKQ